MAIVKCIIKYPTEIDEISTTRIDGMNVEQGEDEEGNLLIERDDTDVANGLNVCVIMHGPVGLTILMDVFIDGEKYNKKPVEAHYMQGGHYVINYNA